jgi:hypothetical protein
VAAAVVSMRDINSPGAKPAARAADWPRARRAPSASRPASPLAGVCGRNAHARNLVAGGVDLVGRNREESKW